MRYSTLSSGRIVVKGLISSINFSYPRVRKSDFVLDERGRQKNSYVLIPDCEEACYLLRD